MSNVITKEEALSRLGKNLRRMQAERGVSQGEVARSVLGKDDISTRNKVSRWFLGKVQPSWFELINLSEFFCCSTDDFSAKTRKRKKVS